MRRALWTFCLGLLVLGVGIGALPWWGPVVAIRQGLRVERAFWCAQGLCAEGLSYKSMSVRAAILDWDRRLTLRQPSVSWSGKGSGEGTSGLPSWLTSVDVQNLQVEGLPVQLPPLSGQVWPDRQLQGENVQITGDTVRAQVASSYGNLIVQVARENSDLQVQASCQPCRYQSEALSEQALSVDIWVDGRLGDRDFSGTVTVGEVPVSVVIQRPAQLPHSLEDLELSGTFRLSSVPVADIYGALASVVPEVARATIRGRLSMDGSFSWPGPSIVGTPVIDGFYVDGLVDERYQQGIFSYPIIKADNQPGERKSGEGSPGWVALSQVHTALPQAIVAAEDGQFWGHPGYSMDGMARAALVNREEGEVRQGGSTLTQQLAKNLFLSGERRYSRKLRELLYAVEMERELGKHRILELYLNIVEWGPGLWGAQPAARTFFLKAPAGLLPEEAAWMASVLPRPRSAWAWEYMTLKPDLGRVHTILRNMIDLSEEEREAALGRGVNLVPPG